MKKWNEFPDLRTCEDLTDYFEDRALTHKEYCHYTKVATIERILESRSLRLSCVEDFNDKCDKKQFGNEQEQKYYYSLCFSTGSTENLSLWYLYSGVDGHGGRISFTKARIKKMIHSSQYYLYEIDGKSKAEIKEVMPLKENDTMKLCFRDVIYSQYQGKNVRLKYNTMTNNDFLSEEFKKYKTENAGIFKNLVWYYEKETRLLVELTGKAREAIDTGKKYAVKMSFPEDFEDKWLKIKFAPEVNDGIYFKIIRTNKKIYNFLKNTSNVKLSDNAGEVEMKLCEKCEHSCFKECKNRQNKKDVVVKIRCKLKYVGVSDVPKLNRKV